MRVRNWKFHSSFSAFNELSFQAIVVKKILAIDDPFEHQKLQ